MTRYFKVFFVLVVTAISLQANAMVITCEDLTNSGKEPTPIAPLTTDVKSTLTKITEGKGYTFYATEVPDSTGTLSWSKYQKTRKNLIRLDLKTTSNRLVATSLASAEGPKFGVQHIAGKMTYVLTCWPSK